MSFLRILAALFWVATVSAHPLDLLFTQKSFVSTNGAPWATAGSKTNLFVGINETNSVVKVIQLATNGVPAGSPLILETNGYGPLLSDINSNFLAVWKRNGGPIFVQVIPLASNSPARETRRRCR